MDQIVIAQPGWWEYRKWPSAGSSWYQAERGDNPYDCIDFHVDLGCGTIPKGRIGIDRFDAREVGYVMELDSPSIRLPFPDSSIKSIISHHFFEHVGEGFIPLVDECYRVLEPGGILRAITPLFPSRSAVEDPDHCRYFMEGTWDSFCGTPGDTPQNCWLASFSVPYSKSRFQMVDRDITPQISDPREWWGPNDAREIRIALEAMK